MVLLNKAEENSDKYSILLAHVIRGKVSAELEISF